VTGRSPGLVFARHAFKGLPVSTPPPAPEPKPTPEPQKPIPIQVPYKYLLLAWALSVVTAILSTLGARYGITIPPPPPVPITPDGDPGDHHPPPGSSPKEPPADPLAAIVRISSGNVGCSATIIGPRRPDGRYWVLTAAHCVRETGQRWTMRFRDGRTVGAQVVNFDKGADWCWMVTDGNNTVLPHALLAEATPAVGTRIWHAGYGVDVPGNREDGTLLAHEDSNGQIKMRISVSSGDSGGGLVVDADGKIISTVCCTTRKGVVADVWGASPERIRAGRRDTVDLDHWNPIDIPVREPVAVPEVMPKK
jgi:hypothetical protein